MLTCVFCLFGLFQDDWDSSDLSSRSKGHSSDDRGHSMETLPPGRKLHNPSCTHNYTVPKFYDCVMMLVMDKILLITKLSDPGYLTRIWFSSVCHCWVGCVPKGRQDKYIPAVKHVLGRRCTPQSCFQKDSTLFSHNQNHFEMW